MNDKLVNQDEYIHALLNLAKKKKITWGLKDRRLWIKKI